MAPLPSEALPPTLTIDGATATLLLTNPSDSQRATKWPACWKVVSGQIVRVDTGFTHCYVVVGVSDTASLNTKTFGAWTVGNVDSGNRFRVLVNDVAGSTDDMKATDFTIRPTTASASGITTHMVLRNDFSNPSGTWNWTLSANMTLTPGSGESIANDVLKVTVTAYFPPGASETATCPALTPTNLPIVSGTAAKCSVGTGLSIITYPAATGVPGTNVPKIAPTWTKNCTTQGTTCAVSVKYDYEVKIIGSDVGRSDDSVSGCGGVCDEGDGTNKLAPCSQFIPICSNKMNDNRNSDIEGGRATGAVITESCVGTPCITIILDVTPANEAKDKEFVLEATLQGVVENHTLTVDPFGEAGKAFSPLVEDLDPDNGEWKFDFTGFPTSKTGTWQIDQWSCVNTVLNGSFSYSVDTGPNGTKGPLHVLTLAADDIATCTAHGHRESRKK